ncbi:hypothetical protein K0M31_013484 [Melipona bicolor]|uniref:Uncharacterized protein n=1 Tax=Melipona bicolor TaxID=60889 RepID=A0AA40FHW7_9HYME|nr:hypothetical protein K0M31_013484 [Melipona bicolor]
MNAAAVDLQCNRIQASLSVVPPSLKNRADVFSLLAEMAVSTNRPVTSAEGELHALVSFHRPVYRIPRWNDTIQQQPVRIPVCTVVTGNVGGPRYGQDSYDDSDAANCARLRLAGLAARTMENNVLLREARSYENSPNDPEAINDRGLTSSLLVHPSFCVNKTSLSRRPYARSNHHRGNTACRFVQKPTTTYDQLRLGQMQIGDKAAHSPPPPSSSSIHSLYESIPE